MSSTRNTTNANSTASILEVARRLADANAEAPVDKQRVQSVVTKMLDGKRIGFDAFYAAGANGVQVPIRDLLRAQLVKLLADIGQADYAAYIDNPGRGAANLVEVVESALRRAEEGIEEGLRYRRSDPELRQDLARRYSPELVFKVLARQTGEVIGSSEGAVKNRTELEAFAVEHGIKPMFDAWMTERLGKAKESALQRLIHRPKREDVEAALALGAKPAEIRKLARDAYLTALSWRPDEAAQVEQAFAPVQFKADSIGKDAKAKAQASHDAKEKQSVADALARFVKNGVDSNEEADKVVDLMQRARGMGAVPEQELARSAVELWLEAAGRTWRRNDPIRQRVADKLSAAALAIAGLDATKEAAVQIEERMRKDFAAAREHAIRDPWSATFGSGGTQDWVHHFFADRFDAWTGDPVPPELVQRMENAIVRFWNGMLHDPEIRPEVRESWVAFFSQAYPELADRVSKKKPHYVGEVEVRSLLESSPFAVSKDWATFLDAALLHLEVETRASDLERMFDGASSAPEWFLERAPGFSPKRAAEFGAEALRLIATLG